MKKDNIVGRKDWRHNPIQLSNVTMPIRCALHPAMGGQSWSPPQNIIVAASVLKSWIGLGSARTCSHRKGRMLYPFPLHCLLHSSGCISWCGTSGCCGKTRKRFGRQAEAKTLRQEWTRGRGLKERDRMKGADKIKALCSGTNTPLLLAGLLCFLHWCKRMQQQKSYLSLHLHTGGKDFHLQQLLKAQKAYQKKNSRPIERDLHL